MRNWFKSYIHNCIIHPMLPFLPKSVGDYLHDSTGLWAYKVTEPKLKENPCEPET